MKIISPEPRHPLVAVVRQFVDAEVRPTASVLEHADRYPDALVARMRELGLFGALVPTAYEGLGLDVTTYAMVIEELCRGWMSLAGVINSHSMAALIVLHHGTDEQRHRLLPRFARGEARGGLCLTEPQAGSDVQAIRTVARRQGDHYVISGTKMFVTNGREGNTFALLALTDPAIEPRHRGMSCFIVEKGHPGLKVAKSIGKLGYKGIDTAELVFEDFSVPAANLVGGMEGRGFKHVMSALEAGRINIAARAVGVAQAALDDALTTIRATATGEAPTPALADMATRLAGARLLTHWAARMKDRGERCDLEAGMAKLHASETAQAIATTALCLHGEAGPLPTTAVERYFRDTPLMIIGEGTNEIQRLLIARTLLERYGERLDALTSREGEDRDRKQIVLAVRQFTEKQIVPIVVEHESASRFPKALVEKLAELGIVGALVPSEYGGLDLDLTTYSMILEELARGWTTMAAIVNSHMTVASAIARFGTAAQREAWLPGLTRGELWACGAFTEPLTARPDRDGWVLSGMTAPVENAPRGDLFAVLAGPDSERTACFLVERETPGLIASPPLATLGARGLDLGKLSFENVRVPASSLLGGTEARGAEHAEAALTIARLGIAATAVGVAQAAFEAALRYSQQRSTFGKPICQHQAIQLKLADMATAITAARVLTYRAAELSDADLGDDLTVRMAKVYASEIAYGVTLDAMRIHGGYGYTTEFPVERYYRDAGQLLVALGGNERERRWLAQRVVAGVPVGNG